MIMSDGLQSNGMPRPDSIIPSIHEINTRRGDRQGHISTNAVWSTNKGFKDFNQRLAKFSSRRVRAATISAFDIVQQRPMMTTPFWNRATQKTAKRRM
jgi:hypothetical protein